MTSTFAVPVRIVSGIDLPAWITAIATIILAYGVLLTRAQLRDNRRTALAEGAASVSRRWDEQELMDARAAINAFENEEALRDAVVAAMDGDDVEFDVELLLREPNFFEDLGLEEFLGGITLQWIEYSMSDIVVDRWNLWAPTIEELQSKNPSKPPIYGNFQNLAKKLSGEGLSVRDQIKRRIAKWLIEKLPY